MFTGFDPEMSYSADEARRAWAVFAGMRRLLEG